MPRVIFSQRGRATRLLFATWVIRGRNTKRSNEGPGADEAERAASLFADCFVYRSAGEAPAQEIPESPQCRLNPEAAISDRARNVHKIDLRDGAEPCIASRIVSVRLPSAE